MSNFNETYYTCNNYATYLERQERYERMVDEIHYDLFRRLCFDFKGHQVLDYGCAVGFVVNALHKIGYNCAHGYDVSEWAINYGRKHVVFPRPFAISNDIQDVLLSKWKLTFALDVFEHMEENQLNDLLSRLNTEYLIVRIPLATVDGGKYVLSVSENDPTHVLRLTRASWMKKFSERYHHLFNINLGLMYDTQGVMCAMFRSGTVR